MKTTMSLPEKVIASLANHERLMQQVGAMKIQIGKHIEACPISQKLSIHYSGSENQDDLIDRSTGRAKTHLWHAFNELIEHDSGYGMSNMDYDDQENYLTDPWNEKTRCEHCFAAWRLIQDRKEVRQKLGNAKRSLRQLGKSALKVTQ